MISHSARHHLQPTCTPRAARFYQQDRLSAYQLDIDIPTVDNAAAAARPLESSEAVM